MESNHYRDAYSGVESNAERGAQSDARSGAQNRALPRAEFCQHAARGDSSEPDIAAQPHIPPHGRGPTSAHPAEAQGGRPPCI